jgi:hypothetical protein
MERVSFLVVPGEIMPAKYEPEVNIGPEKYMPEYSGSYTVRIFELC